MAAAGGCTTIGAVVPETLTAEEAFASEVQAQLAALEERFACLKATLETRLCAADRRIERLESELAASSRLRVGDVVRIHGLDNVAHLHLNSKKAQLRSWEGPGGRWLVEVLQTGEMKSLKPENLTPAPRKGDAFGDPSNRSAIDGSSFPSTDGGCGLSVGDVVQIRGLRKMNQLNGTRAEVLSWDDDGGRWVVRLGGSRLGPQKRLRTCNLKRVGEVVRMAPGNTFARAPVVTAATAGSGLMTLQPGDTVQLHGLVTPGLNGLLGHVQRRSDQADSWVVHLTEKTEERILRSENLSEVEGSIRAGQFVRITGLEQAAYLNGLRAEVLRWNADRMRWIVHVPETAEEKLLRSSNLSLALGGALRVGGVAEIQGLERQEDLNGQVVRLVEWLASEGRWRVRLDSSGEAKLLQPRRLRTIDSTTSTTSSFVQVDEDGALSCGRTMPSTTVPPSNAKGKEGVAEILGGSSDEDDPMTAETHCDQNFDGILREGAEVVVMGSGSALDGRRGKIVDWLDEGGPFGQWVVQLMFGSEEADNQEVGANSRISFSPAHLQCVSPSS
eukprot:TRINITY_DN15678_c0_g2_i1.p1 TRINITY_DN15678_c0_g2~~TRINITY_DN15678_c0_g2_i1.p1  ORF type:complete len:558 (+),score=108.72 TRINITY_DN15678_c0_g2_i1:145-1818(+)